MEPKAMDIISAIMDGKLETSGEVVSMVMQNKNYVMVLTTSMAILIGCVVILMWRRSHGAKKPQVFVPPKLLDVEPSKTEADDGKTKVAVFFGTQTGTAEGFAKVGLLLNFVCVM